MERVLWESIKVIFSGIALGVLMALPVGMGILMGYDVGRIAERRECLEKWDLRMEEMFLNHDCKNKL